MSVLVLERPRKTNTSHRQLNIGRQGLQLAAIIAAQLPEQRDEADAVLGYAVKIVREWLDSDPGSRAASPLAGGFAVKTLKDAGGE